MPRKENLATSVTSISRRRLTLVGLSGHLELSRLLLIGLPELPSEQALELILRFRGYLAIDPVELLPVARAARARQQTRDSGPLLQPLFQRLRIEASENGAQRDLHAGDDGELVRLQVVEALLDSAGGGHIARLGPGEQGAHGLFDAEGELQRVVVLRTDRGLLEPELALRRGTGEERVAQPVDHLAIGLDRKRTVRTPVTNAKLVGRLLV